MPEHEVEILVPGAKENSAMPEPKRAYSEILDGPFEIWVDDRCVYPQAINQIGKLKRGDFCFIEDMSDLMAAPDWMIHQVLAVVKQSPAQFLLLTKNPARYKEFSLPSNVVAGATVESDETWCVSYAPDTIDRLHAMQQLAHPRKMISVEPIMQFTVRFVDELAAVKPEFIAVGYDNYKHGLMEPSYDMTVSLIHRLEARGIKVYLKTIREAQQL